MNPERCLREKIVTEISTLAIASEDPNLFQQKCLQIIGENLDLSRTYIFRHRHETDTMDNTFEWFAAGISPQKPHLQGVCAANAPWWMEMMRNDRIIDCEDIETLPFEAEKGILRPQQIKSVLAVPLFVKKSYYGFMGFDECRYRRKWPPEDVAILKTASEIISMVLEREQNRQELMKSEALLGAAIESLPFDFFVIGADGRYSIINSSARRWGEAVGKRPEEVAMDEGILRCWRENNRRVLSGETVRGEVQYNLDGRTRHFYNVVSPVRIGGEIISIAGMNIDITDRKQMEEALRSGEKRYRDLVENMHEVVYALDRTGRITFITSSILALSGYSPSELIGHSPAEFIYEEDRQLFERYLQAGFRENDVSTNEYRILKKSGGLHWVQTSSRAVYAGDEVVGFQGVMLDIDARKRAEIELRTARDQLELRVKERTIELERRAAQLARLTSELTLAEQRERQQIAEILHDHLQQLMVGAKIRQEALICSLDSVLKSEAEQVLSLINASIKASRTLTAELSPPVLRSGDLSAALDWLARWVLKNHGLEVKLKADEKIVLDREDLTLLLFKSVRELLLNVLKHAGVKFVVVEAGLANGELRITVSDRGSGFDPETVWRDAGSGQRFGLIGIRERVMLMGGSLEVESSPGNGAAFTLVVPLETDRERDEKRIRKLFAKIQKAKAAGNRIRVLLADDHTVVRQGLSTMLNLYADMQIVGEAPDGEEAVNLARRLRPDVILMDVGMPKMNGLEATRIIHMELPHIRIIGLSMYDAEGRTAEMIEAGASAYRSKAGNTAHLLAAIRGEGE